MMLASSEVTDVAFIALIFSAWVFCCFLEYKIDKNRKDLMAAERNGKDTSVVTAQPKVGLVLRKESEGARQ